jgi:hypothetical protein
MNAGNVTYLDRRRAAGRPPGRRSSAGPRRHRPYTELTAVYDRAIARVWRRYLSGCVTWMEAGAHHDALRRLRDGGLR